jgi:predicted phosphodiesterase
LANSRILVISDTHCPFQHPDALKFLRAIKEEYAPDRVIHIGDEIDSHAMSYHDHDPNLFSAGEELKRAREVIWDIEDVYPKVDVIESNHGSLWYRKAKTHGIPREAIKSYEEILKTKKWRWHFELEIRLPNGQPCYFHHGRSANVLLMSKERGMSAVQGHYHEKYCIHYWGTPERLNWAMNVGCLVDDYSLAMEYNNSNLKRPVIGTGMIIDSQPKLIPLVMKTNGRWNGRLT